jgi:hypothetical protein
MVVEAHEGNCGYIPPNAIRGVEELPLKLFVSEEQVYPLHFRDEFLREGWASSHNLMPPSQWVHKVMADPSYPPSSPNQADLPDLLGIRKYRWSPAEPFYVGLYFVFG